MAKENNNKSSKLEFTVKLNTKNGVCNVNLDSEEREL